MAKRVMAKRVIDNSFGGGSLGPVAFDPVRGYSHDKQDPVALLTAYMGTYEDAMRFAKNHCAANGGRIPDLSKAEFKSEDWYAGMISCAANVMRGVISIGNHESMARCRDAICALFAEAAARGVAKPLLNDGEKYREGNANRNAATDKQNRSAAAEREQREEAIEAAARAAFPDPQIVTREEVIAKLCKLSKDEGKGWKRWMIVNAIRGKYGQRAKVG